MIDKSSQESLTLDAAYARYAAAFPAKAKFIKSAICHYLLPYKGFNLGLTVEVGKKISADISLASQIRMESLSDIERVLSWQKQVFDALGTNSNTSSTYRSYLKSFLNWCQDQDWLQGNAVDSWSIPKNPEKSKRHGRGRKDQFPITSRQSLIPYSIAREQLSKETQKRIDEYEKFWTSPHYSDGARPILKPLEKESFIENNLRMLLQLFGWFSLNKLDYHYSMWNRARARKAENPNYESEWLSISLEPPEWLEEMHQKYPPQSVDVLRLENLVPVVKFRDVYSELEDSENLFSLTTEPLKKNNDIQLLNELLEELKAQNATLSLELVARLATSLQQNEEMITRMKRLVERSENEYDLKRLEKAAEAAAIYTRNMVEDFLRWLKFQHNPTGNPRGYQVTNNYSAGFCDDLITLAKFLYKDVTNPLTTTKYQDIPVIMTLRSLRNSIRLLPDTENSTQPVKRNPTWNELGFLLKTLLVYCSPRSTPRKNGRCKVGSLRKQESVAKDFQRYLIVMFLRLVSPDRQHVVRELRVHDTLRLYSIDWEEVNYEEAPWDAKINRYKVYYNVYTKLYYLDPKDAKDDLGNTPKEPKGKPFEWVVTLDKSQTKTDKENSYRVPKIYNSELQAWLYGREDYSGTWDNWPTVEGGGKEARDKWHRKQYNWCGYVDVKENKLSGFRDALNPSHDFVFTQPGGKPLTTRSTSSLYENVIWTYLGFRANPHGVRSASTSHYKRQGMSYAENQSLATLKNHSVETQDSEAYNKLRALEKTALASEMIVNEFLRAHDLDPQLFGFASHPSYLSE